MSGMIDVLAEARPLGELLDNPVWHALHGPHAQYCERVGAGPTASALRYDPRVTPFSALPDAPRSSDWDALRDLVGPAGGAAMFRAAIEPPAGWTPIVRKRCHQMLPPASWPRDDAAVSVEPIRDRNLLDALVNAAKPGPWAERTVELGGFVGVFDGDALVAAGGHRLRLTGATEISAVCTAETHRGRGLARAVVRAISDTIRARGEMPFLHVTTDNTSAIRSYLHLGFTVRRDLEVVVVTAPP